MLHCPQCGRHYSSEVRECPEDGSSLIADPTVSIGLSHDPLVGRVFDGKYRLEALIGEGGMGAVYRATHLLIDRPVAVKVLHSRLIDNESARARFQREARAAGRLQHINAVTVTDFGTTTEGEVYIVMELLEGRSLREVLAREAPLDSARAVSIMLQVSAAVAAAHEDGIIHRDLKPANILIQQRKHAPPVVKVLDFGIAKLAVDSLEDMDQQSLTQTGVMIGTPRYMSPEQCEGSDLTPASDVYSLGIILYEMLTGTTPFSGSSPLALAMKHSREIPRPPREYVGTIAPELENVVLHALEKDPATRPADAGDFRKELYTIAQKLGLEHFAGGGATSLETLKTVGVESPSGRLVVHIDRIRGSQQGTVEIGNAQDTSDNSLATVKSEVVSPRAVPTSPNGVAVPSPVVVPEPAPVSRVSIQLRSRRPWYARPVIVIPGAIAALVVMILLALKIFSSPAVEKMGTSPQPADSPSVAASPSPAGGPQSALPDSSPNQKGTNDGSRKNNETAASRASNQPAKGNSNKGGKSTVKSIFKEAGRILKKPF